MKKLFETINKLALDEINAFGGPSLAHYNLALQKGTEIAKTLKANVELTKCGIALMDIKLGEAMSLGQQSEHIKMSADYAREILTKNKVDAQTQELLLNCVEAHHGGVAYKSLDAEICANADCYRFIHPQGVFTYIQTVSKWGGEQNDAIDKVLAKLEEKHNILSLPVCKKELEPLYQEIKTWLNMAKI